MRTIACIIRKEFIQFFRNKVMVRIIFVMPILQLFVLAYTATFEIKTIRLHVIDLDRSRTSRDLISHFSGSPFYKIVNFTNSYATLLITSSGAPSTALDWMRVSIWSLT
mgnify:CR=1 FL=1